MQNRGKVRYVFTSSYTRRGFHTFIPQLLSGLRRLFVLKGAPGSGQAAFMRQLGEAMLKRGFRAEFWISAFDPLNPEGILIPEIETALVCENSLEPAAYDQIPDVKIIDLALYEKQSLAAAKTAAIDHLCEQIANCNERAAQLIEAAGKSADAIQKITAAHINQKKITELGSDLAERIFDPSGVEKYYFASAITAEGVINYIDKLSQSCRKRYIFTGPAGSGKSAVIKAIAIQAREKDLAVEYYYSGFDAESLAAIIIPNFQVALVDAGYLAINVQPGDEIIDSTQYLDHYDPQQFGSEIMPAQRRNEALLQEAQRQLEKAQLKLTELKRIYAAATDNIKLNRLREEIIAEIANFQPQ